MVSFWWVRRVVGSAAVDGDLVLGGSQCSFEVVNLVDDPLPLVSHDLQALRNGRLALIDEVDIAGEFADSHARRPHAHEEVEPVDGSLIEDAMARG